VGFGSREDDDNSRDAEDDENAQASSELEDGTLDPDEPSSEPAWWDEGSDDET
jgi:hypothetical protein